MDEEKIKIVDIDTTHAGVFQMKENFAYRFGYERKDESLVAFKNRTYSLIASVVDGNQYDLQFYSRMICRLVAYPYEDRGEYSFSSSTLKRVLEQIDITDNKNWFYLWLQIIEFVANQCYNEDDNLVQVNFVSNVAEALKLSGVNAVICWNEEEQEYRFYPATEKFLDEKLVIDVLSYLSKYEKAKKQFQSALDSYLSGSNERQIVDDLRLSLELFLKQFLKNKKSIENQNSALGIYLSDKGVSNEIKNMYWTLVDYYMKFNNNHSKHDDNINITEIDFLLYLTGSFMRFLIKIDKEM